jgi:hypothetical protein
MQSSRQCQICWPGLPPRAIHLSLCSFSQLNYLRAAAAAGVQVKALLSAAKDIDAIIQAVPELIDPTTLSRSLSFLASSFRGKVCVVMWYYDALRCFGNCCASIVSDSLLAASAYLSMSLFPGKPSSRQGNCRTMIAGACFSRLHLG